MVNCLFFLFSVVIKAFVIGLSQISFFFSSIVTTCLIDYL